MEKKEVIFDTDVIIDYLNNQNKRHQSAKRIIDEEIGIDNCLISSVTEMELIVGAFDRFELQRINKNIIRFNIMLVSDDVCIKAVELMQKYNLSHGLQISDAFIAATAINSQLPLFTYNIKDYRFIDELDLYTPIT